MKEKIMKIKMKLKEMKQIMIEYKLWIMKIMYQKQLELLKMKVLYQKKYRRHTTLNKLLQDQEMIVKASVS